MKNRYWFVTVFFLLLITTPYLLANIQAGKDFVFIGFLVNPVDGNSYLAKMQEGYSGDWLFTLPFTNNPGDATPLFLFYLCLGHIARILNSSLIWTFHITRLICSGLLIWTIYLYSKTIFPDQPKNCWRMYAFCLFCSGSGWIFLLLGKIPVDLWVAEAFPWMSMYTNPHFPLGMALLLLVLLFSRNVPSMKRDILLLGLSLLLAIVMPFGVVIVGLILTVNSLIKLIKLRNLEWRSLGAVFVGGGIPVFYQFWLAQSTPQLAAWNKQNITTSPGLIELFVSFSPLLILASYAFWKERKNIFDENSLNVKIWLITGLVLVLIPFNLQRRFLFGLFIPVTCLSTMGINFLVIQSRKLKKVIFPIVMGLSCLTVIMVVFIECYGIVNHSSDYYITTDEDAALNWLRSNTESNATILASPDMGNLIPGQINREVVYGHPFETPDAAAKLELVENFFRGNMSSVQMTDLIEKEKVQYVFYGPRETELGDRMIDTSWGKIVFSQGNVTIFEVLNTK